MNQIDHTNTKVLLIGTSRFPEDATIFPIPNVEINLELFKQSLINPEIIGVPETNITICLNETKRQIEKKLRDISEETKNKKFTLLVYYSGHGILSSYDYKLYLTTVNTSKQDLEIDGINIEDFKKYIKRSYAGRKIVILDCCHSGFIIGAMGDMSSQITSTLNGFEGTYVMTSAAEDEPSLFPNANSEQPTYFTGELVSILNNGLDVDNEYCSLRDIFNKIDKDFSQSGRPRPQQSNFNNADQLFFSLNKKFLERVPKDGQAWNKIIDSNSINAYNTFIIQFPESKYTRLAVKKIKDIEDDIAWRKACNKNTIGGYWEYIDNYDNHKEDARKRLTDLSAIGQEDEIWRNAIAKNKVQFFEEYCKKYPSGKYYEKAKTFIEELTIAEKEEKDWNGVDKENISALNEYLAKYPYGKYIDEAKTVIEKLTITEREESAWKAVDKQNISALNEFNNYYPNSKYFDDAKTFIEKLTRSEQEESAWKAVDKQNISALNEFNNYYPNSKYVDEAKALIEKLTRTEQEESAWTAVDKENISALNEFKNYYPNSKYAGDAKTFIEKLTRSEQEENAWKSVDKENISALDEYLIKYPSGKYYKEAIQQKEEIRKKNEERKAWQKVNVTNTVHSFKKYLNSYPKGQFADEARAKIEALKKSNVGGIKQPGIPYFTIIKYWKIIAVVVVAIIVVVIVFKNSQGRLKPNNTDDLQGSSATSSDSTVSNANIDTLKPQPSTEQPMSAALLDTIKAFSNATHFRYYDFFDGMVKRIELAPNTQQEFDYVKEFKKRYTIAKAKSDSKK